MLNFLAEESKKVAVSISSSTNSHSSALPKQTVLPEQASRTTPPIKPQIHPILIPSPTPPTETTSPSAHSPPSKPSKIQKSTPLVAPARTNRRVPASYILKTGSIARSAASKDQARRNEMEKEMLNEYQSDQGSAH